ncbi:MAG: hypothetical protein GVY22_16995 [Gammaproteobacteria bacterium]|nr:hypothetical protein [Gammaproteobacteria bacterium]
MVELALEGDVAAAKTLLDRIAPPLRARDEAVSVPVSGDPANDAREVVRALGRSEITPVEAATAMRAISEAAKVSELADLENRIAALEQKQ